MGRFLFIGGCLAVFLFGCQPPCTPGELSPMSNTVQRYQLNPRLIDFNIDIGDCEPGHVPQPQARVVGPTGLIGPAEVEIDQREAEIRAGKWPRLAVGTIAAHPAEPGANSIELDFSTVTRSLRADFVEVLDPPRQFRLPVFCFPPLRIENGAVVCTRDAYTTAPQVVEVRDAGLTPLSIGSRLWATPAGFVITADSGLGWLRSGQPLAGWQPETLLESEALGVSASADALVVLREDFIELREAAQPSQVAVRQPNRHRVLTDRPHLVASTSTAVFVSADVLSEADGGTVGLRSTETFELLDGGLTSVGIREGGPEFALTARGSEYWTGDGERLRLYGVGGPPMVGPTLDVREIGSCGGLSEKPACEAGGVLGPFGYEGAFLQCPFVDDGGVRFVSIKLYGLEVGHCEGNYAYVGESGSPDPDGYLDIVDLSPYISLAPYR